MAALDSVMSIVDGEESGTGTGHVTIVWADMIPKAGQRGGIRHYGGAACPIGRVPGLSRRHCFVC